MDIGRDIRTYTIEPITAPVPDEVRVERPAELPLEPETAPA